MSEEIDIEIVDDDESLCRALARLLRAAGYRNIHQSNSAEDFLHAAGRRHPSLLILDVRLPGMSGIDLLEHLGPTGSRIPVVLISSHDEELRRARDMHYDPVAFLSKPFEERDLLSVIHSINP